MGQGLEHFVAARKTYHALLKLRENQGCCGVCSALFYRVVAHVERALNELPEGHDEDDDSVLDAEAARHTRLWLRVLRNPAADHRTAPAALFRNKKFAFFLTTLEQMTALADEPAVRACPQ